MLLHAVPTAKQANANKPISLSPSICPCFNHACRWCWMLIVHKLRVQRPLHINSQEPALLLLTQWKVTSWSWFLLDNKSGSFFPVYLEMMSEVLKTLQQGRMRIKYTRSTNERHISHRWFKQRTCDESLSSPTSSLSKRGFLRGTQQGTNMAVTRNPKWLFSIPAWASSDSGTDLSEARWVLHSRCYHE